MMRGEAARPAAEQQSRIAVLFSGGKDSTWTVHRAKEEWYNVVALVSLVSKNADSYMFQSVNLRWAPLLAEALGIRIVVKETAGRKEEELGDLEAALRELKPRIDCVGAGALASKYQYERVAAICKKLQLAVFAPAWQMDPERYWEQLLAAGFRVVLTKVACAGLGREWLGREIDREALEELKALSKKHRFHLGGEGGEFESIVLDSPVHQKRVRVEEARAEWHGDWGQWVIERAVLEKK